MQQDNEASIYSSLMGKLTHIASKAIADYGFRQVVLWSTEDVISRWKLSPQESNILVEIMLKHLEQLPNPVEPKDIPTIEAQLTKLMSNALED